MSHRTQHTLILVLILLGILIAGFFGLRAVFAFREFRRHGPPPIPPFGEASEGQPTETDVELIRDWMTIPYISQTYQIHPRLLFEALGVSPRGNEEKSLAQLNEEFLPQSPGLVLEVVKAVAKANLSVSTNIEPDAPVPPNVP